nr:cytochrome c biogenesis protein CcdA [Desulfobacterales bacterium]
MEVTVVIAFCAGFLSFFSPCTFPLIPSYLCFIMGMSYDELLLSDKGTTRRRLIITHSTMFILGFTFIFVSLGLSFSFFA